MEDFIRWFRKQGGSVDTEVMGLADIPEQGRGAIALRDIPAGHTLFSIPRGLTLSTRTSKLHGLFGEKAWKEYRLHEGWVGPIICMMWEEAQGEASKWSTYLASLPTSFDTPMFWEESDLKELDGTTVVDKIGREDAERDYIEKLLPAVKSRADLFRPGLIPVHYSLEKYHIMGSRILSRSFHVEKSEHDDDASQDELAEKADEMDVDGAALANTSVDMEEPGSEANASAEMGDDSDSDDDEDEDDPADVAMVPMADMLNARFGCENAKLFYEERELNMITTKPIKANEQIWNTYGDPPNSDLLRRYGHIDVLPLPGGGEGNPGDIVEIPANLLVDAVAKRKGASPSIYTERIDWWLEEGGDDVFELGTNYNLPDALISLCKLILHTDADWEKARAKGKIPKPKLDTEVIPIAIATLEARLAQYPTSLEADEELLKTQTDLPVRRRRAIVVRLGEKRILAGCLSRLREHEQSFTASVAPVAGKKRKHER